MSSIGKNAQGKTNLLKLSGFAAEIKLFAAQKESQIIQFDKPVFQITWIFPIGNGYSISGYIAGGKKKGFY